MCVEQRVGCLLETTCLGWGVILTENVSTGCNFYLSAKSLTVEDYQCLVDRGWRRYVGFSSGRFSEELADVVVARV